MKRIILIATLAAACGGTSSLAVDHNRAGSGTSTLNVDASVSVIVSSTAPLTAFSVDVTDGTGANVSGATVTMHNAAFGDVPLVEASVGSGTYTNAKTSYPSGDLSLSIVRGTDKVQGVVVGYPGEHAIIAPTVNSTVSSAQPLHVAWTTPVTAKAASVSTRDYSIDVPDTGTYDIAPADNPVRTDQRVTIVRSNEVEIAGALPGSMMSVKVTTRVDPFVVN